MPPYAALALRALASVLPCTRRCASSVRLAYGALNGLRTIRERPKYKLVVTRGCKRTATLRRVLRAVGE